MKANREPLFPHQPGYPPSYRGRFSRVIPSERSLLTYWLDHHGAAVREMWFDVRTDGTPGDVDPRASALASQPIEMQRMWQAQTAKRMDCITLQEYSYRILEARGAVGAQTLGEIMQYDALSRAEWPALTWLPLTLICYTVDPIHRRLIEAQGFAIVVVNLIVPVEQP